jgi:riboflavin kinase / FMN adenylyltransferase
LVQLAEETKQRRINGQNSVMKIFTHTEIPENLFQGSVVTIGNFDGVHRGHAELFRCLKQESQKLGLPSIAVTFEPHPLKLFSPELAPRLITTYQQKAELIAESGIDFLVVIDFTTEFARLSATEFVSDFLCGVLGMRHIIIGHDYAFGRDRQGNYATLKEMGEHLGFSIESLHPVGESGQIFSSSLVRNMLSSGDVAGAANTLGRYHVITGRVVHGREIGTMLGFPTANLSVCNELIPADGVYAVLAAVAGRLVEGACNIGTCPTFEGNSRTVEVFLLDFSGQLYNQELSFCFVERLRGEKKFPDADALVKAISDDVKNAREILSRVDQNKIKTIFAKCPPQAGL